MAPTTFCTGMRDQLGTAAAGEMEKKTGKTGLTYSIILTVAEQGEDVIGRHVVGYCDSWKKYSCQYNE